MMKDKPVILIVDDQFQNIELLEAHLKPQGYDIVRAASGEEALEKLSGDQIDLVLLDVIMPGMSGFEVLAKLRADRKAQRIPVVMITAHRENELGVMALEAGCDDFISKPFDKHELLARVRSLLRIKHLNDEADASREFAENIINTVREPLIALDQHLRVVTASRSFYEFFKVKPEETVGQLIYDLGNKQWDIPWLRHLLETILPQKTTFDDYEVEHDFTAIGRRIMLLNARQIKRGTGKERIILLAIEDITERKRLEDLLSESETRYRRIYETASDGIVLLEKKEGKIAHANPAAMNMLCYDERECIGKHLQDIGISIDTSDFPMLMQDLRRSGIINYEDVRVKTRVGQDIYADIYMVDRAALAQCNIRDVTERKRSDEALRESQQILEGIINTIPVRVFWKDKDLVYLGCNTAFARDAGFADPKDIIGKDDYQMGWRDQADLYRSDDRQVIQSGRSRFLAEEPQTTPEGNTITLLTSKVPLLDSQGEIIGVLGTYMDITDQKKLEAQLLHAQKMEAVDTLAGGIAHDFNNILHVIVGYGTLVMNKLGPGNPSKEHMHEVLIAAERAADLTKRLLVFSRKTDVDVKPLNINDLILGLQKMLVGIIRANIDFNVDLAARPLTVLADAGQLEQVLMNLATNARDAMPDGGRLTISTGVEEVDEEYAAAYGYGKPGRYALITVSDTGQGMDAEIQKKIFEPFFTTKGIGEGTGLGLAISYGIIKQHKGYIKVYSEPGQGTVFKIYLPVSEAAASSDKKTEAAAPVKGGNETILVAEDDATLRKLATIVLESLGYRVISAVDGDDAISKFADNRERINLVLLDMIMPKKSGKEVGEAIRKIIPGMKILLASGYAMDVVKARELSEAGVDFISKPFQPKDLLKKVREILDREESSGI